MRSGDSHLQPQPDHLHNQCCCRCNLRFACVHRDKRLSSWSAARLAELRAVVCGLSGAPLSSGTLKNLEVLIDGSVPFVWPLRELAYGAIRGLISPQSVQCSVFSVHCCPCVCGKVWSEALHACCLGGEPQQWRTWIAQGSVLLRWWLTAIGAWSCCPRRRKKKSLLYGGPMPIVIEVCTWWSCLAASSLPQW